MHRIVGEIRISEELEGSHSPVSFDYDQLAVHLNHDRQLSWIDRSLPCYVLSEIEQLCRPVGQESVNGSPLAFHSVSETGIGLVEQQACYRVRADHDRDYGTLGPRWRDLDTIL